MIRGFSLITKNQPGVLRDVAAAIAEEKGNITYTQLHILETGRHEEKALLNMEVDEVKGVDLVEKFEGIGSVIEAKEVSPFKEVYGRRIIITGGGAQVAEVASGAISEADRHNLRGEHISVDTIPLVGEKDLYEAAAAVKRLHRSGALVLAGALLGGEVTEAVKEVKREGIPVICLKNVGSAQEEADLVVSDPVLAGVLAVMTVSKTGEFDIKKVKQRFI